MTGKTSDSQMPDRLKRRSDFLRVQAAGHKWVSKSMIVQIAPNAGTDCRFGLTVSKKTEPTAVLRNRIRRRLRAMALSVLPAYAGQGHDIVIIGRKPAETSPFADLQNDLTWCLKRLGLQEAKQKGGKGRDP